MASLGDFLAGLKNDTQSVGQFLQQRVATPVSQFLSAHPNGIAYQTPQTPLQVAANLPGGLITEARDIPHDLQQIPRSFFAGGASLGQAALGHGPNSFNPPNTMLGRTLLGTDPINTYQGAVAQNAPALEHYGLSPNLAKAGAGLGFVGNIAANAFQGTEQPAELAFKDIAKATTKDEVLPLVEKLGLHPDIATQYLPEFQAAKTPEAVGQVAAKAQQAGEMLRQATSALQPSDWNNLLTHEPQAPSMTQGLSGLSSPQEANPFAQAPQESQLAQTVKQSSSTSPSDPLQAFKDWVNGTRPDTLHAEGQQVAQHFAPTDAYSEQIHTPSTPANQQFLRFQANTPADTTEASHFSQLRNYFDTKYQQLQQAGVPVPYQENYLKQAWANTPEQINAIVDRTLATNPGLSRSKIIADYPTGMAAGLTPKYTKLSELAGAYEQESNRAIRDTQYLNHGIGTGTFTDGPTSVNTHAVTTFPGGRYYAPPDVGQAVTNHMSQAKLLTTASQVGGEIKKIALAGGVPGTSWNFHGITTAGRDVLTAGNPIKAVRNLVTDIGAMTYNPANHAYMNAHLDGIVELLHHGLTLSTEAPSFHETLAAKGPAQALLGSAKGFFEHPLFEGFLPATKARFALEATDNMTAKGVAREEALRAASHSANTIFGGNNLAELGANKDYQNVLKTVFLAPDTIRSQVGTATGMAKALLNPKSPEYWAYRSVALNTAAAYTIMNLANKAQSGHYMYQNAPGHTFEIQAGYDADGNARFIRPLGQALDFVKIPVDAATSIAHGDLNQVARVVQNRLSPVIAQAVQLATNTNAYGHPITKPNDTPDQKLVKYGTNAASAVLPLAGAAALRGATGQTNREQTIGNALGLPVRYGVGAPNAAEQQTQAALKASGATGSQIGTTLDTVRANTQADAQTKQALKQGTPSKAMTAIGPGLYQLSDGKLAYLDGGSVKTYDPKHYDGSYASFKTLTNDKTLPDSVKQTVIGHDPQAQTYTQRLALEKQLPVQQAQAALALERYKVAHNLPGWLQTAQQQQQQLQSYLQTINPQSDPTQYAKTQLQLDNLQTQMSHYQGQGGFTKGRSARGGKGRSVHAPSALTGLHRPPSLRRMPSVPRARIRPPKASHVTVIHSPKAKAKTS